MARIPTLIPQYWRDRAARYWNQSLLDRLWQALLVVAGGLLVVAALSSGTVLVASIAGIVISIVLADDIRQTVVDVWRRDFWIWKV